MLQQTRTDHHKTFPDLRFPDRRAPSIRSHEPSLTLHVDGGRWQLKAALRPSHGRVMAEGLSIQVRDLRGVVVGEYAPTSQFPREVKAELGRAIQGFRITPQRDPHSLLTEVLEILEGPSNVTSALGRVDLVPAAREASKQVLSAGRSGSVYVHRVLPDFESFVRNPKSLDSAFRLVMPETLLPRQVLVSAHPKGDRISVLPVHQSAFDPFCVTVRRGEDSAGALWRVIQSVSAGGFEDLLAESDALPDGRRRRNQSGSNHTLPATLSGIDAALAAGEFIEEPDFLEILDTGSAVSLTFGERLASLSVRASHSEEAASRSWVFLCPTNGDEQRENFEIELQKCFEFLRDPVHTPDEQLRTIQYLNALQDQHTHASKGRVVPQVSCAQSIESVLGYDGAGRLASIPCISVATESPRRYHSEGVAQIIQGMQTLRIDLEPRDESVSADTFTRVLATVARSGELFLELENALGDSLRAYFPPTPAHDSLHRFFSVIELFADQPQGGRESLQLYLEEQGRLVPKAEISPRQRSALPLLTMYRTLDPKTGGVVEPSVERASLELIHASERRNRDYVFLGSVGQIALDLNPAPLNEMGKLTVAPVGTGYRMTVPGEAGTSLTLEVQDKGICAVKVQFFPVRSAGTTMTWTSVASQDSQKISATQEIRALFRRFYELPSELTSLASIPFSARGDREDSAPKLWAWLQDKLGFVVSTTEMPLEQATEPRR